MLTLITTDDSSTARAAKDLLTGAADRNDAEERDGDGARRSPDNDGGDSTAAVEVVAMAIA